MPDLQGRHRPAASPPLSEYVYVLAFSSGEIRARQVLVRNQTEMGYRPYSKVASRMALKFARGTYSGMELLDDTA